MKELIWIGISVVILVLLVVFIFVSRKSRKDNKLTPLTGLAFLFIILGIISGGNRLMSYSLFGVGIALAVVDIILKSRKGQKH